MELKVYAHLAVLFQVSAFVFLLLYILFGRLMTFPIILLLSIGISEIILHLFLRIRVVQID